MEPATTLTQHINAGPERARAGLPDLPPDIGTTAPAEIARKAEAL
ncbi:hypothetical protein [Paenarthrobacter nicotinovorans]